MAAFDATTFQNNIDKAKIKKTLKIAGKEIPLPTGTDVGVQVNGDYIRVTVSKAEHRELQLAGESRVVSTDYLYNNTGDVILEFQTDTDWAVSSAPRMDLVPQDLKTLSTLPVNKGNRKIH